MNLCVLLNLLDVLAICRWASFCCWCCCCCRFALRYHRWMGSFGATAYNSHSTMSFIISVKKEMQIKNHQNVTMNKLGKCLQRFKWEKKQKDRRNAHGCQVVNENCIARRSGYCVQRVLLLTYYCHVFKIIVYVCVCVCMCDALVRSLMLHRTIYSQPTFWYSILH